MVDNTMRDFGCARKGTIMIYLRTLTIGLGLAAMSLVGCGGGGDVSGPPPAVTTQISSDPVFDGDIQQTSPTTYLVTQGMSPTVQSVFAGIDPVTLTEIRAFLDFPLTGAGGVPTNAMIDTASLDIYIDSFQPSTGTLPLRIELVAFQQPLLGTDFDRALQPPLAFVAVSPAFTQADVGTNVSVDVTPLMVEAQARGLADFQVRIMEDLGPAIPGLLEIDDNTGANRATRAPELTITYIP